MPRIAPSTRRWRLLLPAPADSYPGLDEFPRARQVRWSVLHRRGVRDEASARAFLSQDGPPLHDPFALDGMEVAVERIGRAIRQGERIAIHGDYDTDGVTATALLVESLRSLGADFIPYLPHRVRDGYGLKCAAVDNLADQGARLLITVDCGISANVEVARARERGLDVIVTDHHLPRAEEPPALAVINPNRSGSAYPFKGLAGVGVAFKLVQALGSALGGFDPDDLLDLVALGTVADVVPLLDENRHLVKAGLAALAATRRPGLRALAEVARVQLGRLTARGIAFGLAPRLNAPGRIDAPDWSFRLLTTTSEEEARQLAETVNRWNTERLQIELAALEPARQTARAQAAEPILIVKEAALPQGVLGLVAGKLCQEFYRPAVVIGVGEELSRGSVRSIPEFPAKPALDRCADLLLEYGGHAAAAGFTVLTARLPELAVRLGNLAGEALGELELEPTLWCEAELPLKELDASMLGFLDRLAPFGDQNAAPLFLARGVRVRDVRPLEGGHLRLRLAENGDSTVWRAVAFRHEGPIPPRDTRLDVVYSVWRDDWRGGPEHELHVEAMVGTDDRRPTTDGSVPRGALSDAERSRVWPPPQSAPSHPEAPGTW